LRALIIELLSSADISDSAEFCVRGAMYDSEEIDEEV